jgi:hypothetical protein
MTLTPSERAELIAACALVHELANAVTGYATGRLTPPTREELSLLSSTAWTAVTKFDRLTGRTGSVETHHPDGRVTVRGRYQVTCRCPGECAMHGPAEQPQPPARKK